MNQEIPVSPAPKRPYEIFGLTEQEALFWRIDKDRFHGILEDDELKPVFSVPTTGVGHDGRVYEQLPTQSFSYSGKRTADCSRN